MNVFQMLRGRNDAVAPTPSKLPDVPATGGQVGAVEVPAAIVIDVRSEQEFAQGAVQGALSLPLNRLADGIRGVAPDPATPLWLYCASGARSGMGVSILQRLGYRNVGNAGGLFQAAARLQRSLG